MKVMIVSNSKELRASIIRFFTHSKDGIKEIIQADHEDALEKFLEEEPEKVVICEYEEKGNKTEEWNIGRSTYKDIKGSAGEEAVVIRMGFSKYDYEDYVKVPSQLSELLEKL